MKRLISSLLAVSIFFGTLTVVTLTAAADAGVFYAGMGNYTVALEADPSTGTVPEEFGTVDANGKVWTDKSVTANQDRFEVTLSALAQEYISTDQTTTTANTAADVVMILDLSASMQTNLTLDNVTMTRTKAMVKAVNEALEIIMETNEKNRVLIYTYQSDSSGNSPVTNELLPLGHYSNTSWNNSDIFSGNSGKYINYSTSGSNGRLQTASSLKKDGTRFTQKSLNTGSGTCTQHGILKGIQTLITAIGKETKTIDRKPYVLLFTDGTPINATQSWYDAASTTCSFQYNNNGTPQITALSVLTAALMKDRLNTAYQIYNGKDMGIEWLNIGLGVENSDEPTKTANGLLFLQPWKIATETSTIASNTRDHIATYTSGKYATYASYASDYTYTLETYIVDQGDELEDAFNSLAEKVQEETKEITSPIMKVGETGSDLTFTDTIGAGMSVRGITLQVDTQTTIAGVASGNTYTFTGYDMTVQLSTDVHNRTVLTWNIPADEMAIFSFADRANPTNGNYIEADPLRLTYDVAVTDPGTYDGQILYSNASATACFSVPSDNTYYYEAGDTLKTALFIPQTKSQNITGLSQYHVSYTTDPIQNGVSITAIHGNNGRISPVTELEKSANDPIVQIGTTASFTLAVTNRGQSFLRNVILTDTLPEGLTYQEGSVQNATVSVDGVNLTFMIPTIAVGQTVSVTYNVVLSSNAAQGETLTNTVAITRINEIDVYGPVETTATIIAYRAYQVFYEWTGEIPAGQTLPTDDNRYITGANYPTDSTYTDQTKIENKDQFGNVTERWTFSGWEDPNHGQMGETNVIIRGIWNYESLIVPAHRVQYVWSGDIPSGKTLPTDDNFYVKNQPYSVDTTYTAATTIETKDAYGNINSRYTFSGWADPNNGVMGETDVTISGIWNYQKVEVPTYRLIYTWTGTIPTGQILPTDGNSYVPGQSYTVDTAYTNATVIETKDAYGNVNGRYTFSGWSDPNVGVMGNANVTISGVWQYESVSVPSHQIYYVWSGEVPQGQALPTDVKSYYENQSYAVDDTYTSATVIPTYDEFGNLNGRYVFSGWTDPNGGVMGQTDITVRGVWEYHTIPVLTHKVIYLWSGQIPDGQTLPLDPHTYVLNQPYSVDGTYTAQTVIPTYDAFGNINGRYIFSGWNDPNNGVMGDEDVTILGQWRYEPITVPTHQIFYVWSGGIPEGIHLPTDENTYVYNQPYSVDGTYTAQTVIPTYDAFGNINGHCTFSGWSDFNNNIMGNEDITIRGDWQYEPITVPSHQIFYAWSGDVPQGVDLPTDENTYVHNQPYLIDTTFTAETEIPHYDSKGDSLGLYSFSGWIDPNEGKMGEEDVTIVGVWEYEPLPVTPPTPSEPSKPQPPDPQPSNPETNKYSSLTWILSLWALSSLGVILLHRKKKI